jgi:hypothetical protein
MFSNAPQTPLPIMPGGYDRFYGDAKDTAKHGQTRVRRARAFLLPFVAAILLAGCSGSEPLGGVLDTDVDAEARPKAVAVATPEAGDRTESTVGVASSDAVEDAGSSPEPFGAGPRAEGGTGFEADTLLAVRHGMHEGFERVVLDLGAGKEPAVAVPRWTLDSPGGRGLLRVNLPSANATGVSDGAFGRGLLESFHVVRAPEGGMFVDVSARKDFRYRVFGLTSPARLVMDFRPAGGPLTQPALAEGENTVLVEPRPGAAISDPLTVSGYSRNFEASNTITLTNAREKVLLRTTVTANDWSSTWGYFEATLDLPPFTGRGTLKVGTESARDGTFEGVEIEVKGS